MNHDSVQPAQDDATFEPDEKPTNPSAPAPEELARQTWLASETRAIGPRRSATSKFRAVAVAAVEGGAARVSHVDMVEANARAQAEQGAEQEVQQKEENAPGQEVREEEAAAGQIAEVQRPVLGPRGTVRIAARVELGPTGTVKMRAPLAVTASPDGAARRAARIRSMVVVGVMVLCALDAAWVAFRPAPSSAPAHTSAPAYSLPAAIPQPAPTTPPDTEPANGFSPAAASSPAPSPAAPATKHVDKRRRPTPSSTVF